MGLADAQALAECVKSAVAVGSDVGSRTSLLPYARSRYFENHKLLSATDKLHKLYSSTLPPIVWARSVGLEVINELDTLKAALMMSAGATAAVTGRGSSISPWQIAAKGVEVVGGIAQTTAVLGRAVAGVAKAGVDNLPNSYSRR